MESRLPESNRPVASGVEKRGPVSGLNPVKKPEFLEAVPAGVDGNRFAPSRSHFREGPIVRWVIPHRDSCGTPPTQNLGSIECGATAVLARNNDARESILGAVHKGSSAKGKVARILVCDGRQQEYSCLIGYCLISEGAPIYLPIFIGSVPKLGVAVVPQ